MRRFGDERAKQEISELLRYIVLRCYADDGRTSRRRRTKHYKGLERTVLKLIDMRLASTVQTEL